MNEHETILTDVSEAGVFRITLNRPDLLNAINDTMWRELLEVFVRLRSDPNVRVVVITGAGRGFCSGADVTPREAQERPHLLWKMRFLADVAVALQCIPQPTIAQVNGVAAGAGCNIALGCDLIVASEHARFSEIFARRGLSVDFGGTWLLPRLIGLHRAKELAFFGDVISAAEADRIGLVNRVVPADELEAFVAEWAERLCLVAPVAIAQSKVLLNESVGPSLRDALDAEGAAQTINHGTQDTPEAMAAYRERRNPAFGGR